MVNVGKFAVLSAVSQVFHQPHLKYARQPGD
jgi:hypothetical protein